MPKKVGQTDVRLGVGRAIDRRDFLNGVAVAIGMGVVPQSAMAAVWPQDQSGYYPPSLTGMRGSHPGSFEGAHALRDGEFWTGVGAPLETRETYDLIIVGAGISGLSAAYFYRAARPDAKILILDNHDDFGGHAKRNEYRLDGKLHLMNGGTLEIDSPRPYSPVASGLLQSLGVDPVDLAKRSNQPAVYRDLGLGHGLFFDRETFGADRLVAGAPNPFQAIAGSWPDFLAKAPLSATARDDVLRIETGEEDYLPGLTSEEKKDRLSRMSYRDYLLSMVKASPEAVAMYQSHTHGEWGAGIDAVSALDAWGFFLPGFRGLKLKPGSAPRMSYTPAGYADGGSPVFHFPDGNASLARLLVRRLVPGSLPGSTCEDVVAAQLSYGLLDRPGNTVRLRLSSLCVRARNLGPEEALKGVEVAYVRIGKVYRATARACVLASWNMMIPYLCPEMPASQKTALHKIVKTPLVYTTVALRNWTAFAKLGIYSVTAPGGYHSSFRLNWPVDIGELTAERDPNKPILLHMTRTPCRPGLPELDQHIAGRAELLATPFATFEREIRSQLGKTLAAGGFDPARDITGITVNRWPHGYAPEWNPLWQAVLPHDQQPNVVGRQRFGRITIANSDAAAAAYTDAAIDQAHRAVNEILAIDV